VVDDDSLGYYLMFNIPIVLYFILFLYVLFACEQGYFSPTPPAVKSDQENLLAQPVPAKGPATLSPSLYHKLHLNMKIQRAYGIIWFISVIPNFFMLTEAGLVWYSIANTLHPIIIIVIMLWALSLNAQSLERSSGKDAKTAGGPNNEGKGTELSDYSSFLDDRSDVSVGDAAEPAEAPKGAKGAFEDTDLSQRLFTNEQLNSFKDIVKNHVLENIILGIQNGMSEKPAPRNLYDKDLGFGQPSGAIPKVEEGKKDGGAATNKAAESNISYAARHTKSFFSFKTQAVASQISIKDPNAEALVLEGLVLGHPDILRKFNIAIKQDELEKQCKVEKVFKGVNPEKGSIFEFVEMAPEIFHMIRKI
jgi:hypothetical protein